MSTTFYLSYGLLWAVVIFQSLLVVGLVRRLYSTQPAQAVNPPAYETQGLPRGNPAPAFTAVDLDGRIIDNSIFADRLTAMLFVSPACATCAVTLNELNALLAKTGGNVIVVCRDDAHHCRPLAERYELKVPFVIDTELRLSDLFAVTTNPTAVLVDSRGRIETYGHPMSGDDLEGLMTEMPAPDARDVVVTMHGGADGGPVHELEPGR